MSAYWGERPCLSARAGLLLAAGLLIPALLLGNGYESTLARVHTQGSWCERIGPSGGTDGTVAGWWEDGRFVCPEEE